MSLASGSPVSVGTEALVEVSAVEVDQVVAALDDLVRDDKKGPFRLGPICLAGIEAVHALAIDRIEVRHFLLERSNIR